MSTARFDIIRPDSGEPISPSILGHLDAPRSSSAVEELSDLRTSARRYIVDEDLATAINMALCVRAPLLITGEPGTGKTQVAYYLEWALSAPLFRYQVRSTSTATDLKYDFDAVAYLRYSHDRSAATKQRSDREFLKKHALWLAYESEEPCILLVDEIDKAPRDFPNDLLREIDEHEFEHPFADEVGETERTIKPKAPRPPIVIATSNAERKLPDAFLRRCIVHHIALDDNFIRRVVESRVSLQIDPAVRSAALTRIFEMRSRQLSRTPSTAEALTWLAVLAAMRVRADTIKTKPLDQLPGLQALVKDPDDRRLLSQ